MSDKTVHYLSEILLAENEECPSEIQVLRAGKFNSFWYGDFEVTPKILREMKKNFDEKIRGVDLAIDFGHRAGEEAAGWIKSVELKKRDTELWAQVEWTELGCSNVKKKLYRYLSAEYDTAYKDNETGETHGFVLLGAGLTNRPFVKGMKATTELMEVSKMADEKLKEVEAANLKLSTDNDKLKSDIKTLDDTVKKQAERIKELETEIKNEKLESEFAKMLEDKKVVPAQKDAWMAQDLKEFTAKACDEEINLDEQGSDKNDNEGSKKLTIDDVEKAINKKLQENPKMDISEAMSIVFEENPKMEKAYFEHEDAQETEEE